jgi:hypothetical protein
VVAPDTPSPYPYYEHCRPEGRHTQHGLASSIHYLHMFYLQEQIDELPMMVVLSNIHRLSVFPLVVSHDATLRAPAHLRPCAHYQDDMFYYFD